MNKSAKGIIEALKPLDEEFKKEGLKDYPLYLSVEERIILLDYITSLEEKLETEHKAYMGTVKELTETATRIDKALDFINQYNIYFDDSGRNHEYIPKELINILKGSDK